MLFLRCLSSVRFFLSSKIVDSLICLAKLIHRHAYIQTIYSTIRIHRWNVRRCAWRFCVAIENPSQAIAQTALRKWREFFEKRTPTHIGHTNLRSHTCTRTQLLTSFDVVELTRSDGKRSRKTNMKSSTAQVSGKKTTI